MGRVRESVTAVAREDRTWSRPLVYNSHRLIELCGRTLKGFTRRVRELDRALFRVIFGLKWAPLTAVMRAFTVAGTAGALWGFLAALAFLFTGLEPLRLLIPWVAVAASWTVAEGAKYLFDRARPFMWDAEIAPLTKTPSSSSFPSGHSATAAAGALTLSVLYPPFAPALVLAGILVVLSRVYLGVHYPFDVLAGVIIGIATAGVVLAGASLVA
jgi:undecaprenyl-diphosphatase